MSYIVLARKYRPQNFNELIGQEHIAEILTKAIATDKVGHAYLFCGPRGTGKTSAARILAMCLNCEDGPKINPDVTSPLCQEIAKSNSMDVLEIDGASNRGIDEIRTLRENVKFSPGFSRYKIYIVDEVHMLTTEAFNALLKTLEEPPGHVKFIFATTDPNKVPATIISRCQRFDFKRIPVKTIVGLLNDISVKENLDISDEALYAIAKAGQGSMRDALSVLDQMSALSERRIDAKDVYSMLGLVEVELLFQLTDAIGNKDGMSALNILQEIIDKGKDIKQLYRDLIDHFRNLMILKVGGKALGKLVDYPINIKEQILKQTSIMTLKDIIVSIDVFIQAQESSRVTESLRIPLEIALAKLTYQQDQDGLDVNASTAINANPALKSKIALNEPQDKMSGAQKILQKLTKDEIGVDKIDDRQSAEDETVWSLDKIKRMWDSLTHAVSRKKMSLATYLQEGTPVNFEQGILTIGFLTQSVFQKEEVEHLENKKLIQDIFAEKFKNPIQVKCILSDDHTTVAEDNSIQATLDAFGGKVVSRWHNE